ncbi:MAG TPA: hypothetical protein VFK51_09670 [Burkholderiales bacterium]|jgi:hypothetical protein|nr:hypothetical protein [Burkholderiales bacterium]
MDAIQWLDENAPGFAALGHPERVAPMHFSLLWSYFEAEALHANGSSYAVTAWIRDLHQQGKLDPAAFYPALNYFKKRYFEDGRFTHHFNSLNIRNNDSPAMVKAVLSGNNRDPVDSVIALFIIIYRFRNNYFHGSKWAYNLRGQLCNFTVANESLMRAMDMCWV